MKFAFLTSGLGFIFLMTGCLLGPDYHMPDLEVPKDWGRMSLAGDSTHLTVSMPLIGAGKFLGEGVLIFGIVGGLATIIIHLSF